MKILANDGLVEEGIQYLHKEGFEVDTVKRDLDDLIGDIKDFDALLVRSATKVTREVIEAGTKNGGKLKVVGRGGVGTDNIDLVAARENGVIVKFAPNGNTNATAEHALGLMFGVARKVPFAHATLKSGIWHKKRFQGGELMGKTLGIIGCGRIGQALATKAKALGMKVVGFDVYRKLDSEVDYLDTVDDVLRVSDFVSLHTGGRETLIGPKELKIMKNTAYLVNASRGVNVDEDALYDALKNGEIAGAALDTYRKEPKREGEPFENRLMEFDNVVFSAHLGASTRNAMRRTGLEIAEVVAKYLRLGDFNQSVNAGQTVEEEGREIYTIFITHEDTPGMFGKFGVAFGEMGVNIRENNSRKLNDHVQTVYVVHQKPTPEVCRRIGEIAGVKRVAY
ncbi:phosphoglycerate dehydrogenase [Desulfolutivibrio sulfoxidireducens]|uniref:phosphoglycerate dehydrogenase n=1 Tax=Desulfolutivibrio sulfoxidireducens TaxID=2773299 RepID=UPI00159E3201|nr:phosphoglycerate dehydrogenase [Desulfolutivibrio sulfoxidireducens]QLA15420.1 hydroxyacid dehydrogenase [Desulfolutivibrio sulfoxidireducens]QLA19018.1 hydroxyacid dehydrogenase [Desulfolutivibrio sulfoxidireducens]